MKTLSFFYAKLILCIVAFCILTSNTAEAQSSVKVKVVDSLSGKGVEFVSVSLYEAPANSTVKYSDTDSSGRAILNNIKPGNYQLKIYHMNYFPVVKNIHVKGKVYDIGELKIKENAKRMDAVTVTAIAQAITIKKDTIEFNTAAFSVKDGDVLEQLLFKIPGLVIDKEGKMTYNGKEINKILVDGKEFMANNPKLLQKNLPAKAIDKLKVYDKKSELAQATGVDDGNSENVLDLSVKKEFKKMLFGAVSATIGTEDKHAASIFLSKLNEKSRFGVAAYNFKNVMGAFGGFGGDDIPMTVVGGGVGGLMETINVGAEGATEIKNSPYTLNGSFQTNIDMNPSFNSRRRQTFLTDSSFIYNNKSTSDRRTQSNNFNAGILTKSTSKHNITAKISGKIGETNSSSTSEYRTDGVHGTRINEGQSNNSSINKDKSLSINFSEFLKMKKKGRVLSFGAQARIGDNSSTGFNNSYTTKYSNNTSTTDTIRKKSIGEGYNGSISGNIGYNEPLTKTLFLNLSYNFGINRNHSDKASFDWNPITKNYDIVDKKYSSLYDYLNIYQNIGIILKKDFKKGSVSAGFGASPSYIKTENNGNKISNSTVNYYPTIRYEYTGSKNHFLTLSYSGSSSQPSATQLQPLPNITNPLYIVTGNPGLISSFMNKADIQFRGNFAKKTISLMTNLSCSYLMNGITNVNAYGKGGVQYSAPINANGTYSGSVMTSLNIAAFKKKVNFGYNFRLSVNNSASYTAQIKPEAEADPSKIGINDFINISKIFNNNIRLNNTLSISGRFKGFDIYSSLRAGYNNTLYSVEGRKNPETWDFSFTTLAVYSTEKGLSAVLTGGVSKGKGYNSEQDKTRTLINLSLSQKFFKNKLSCQVGVTDLLNQNKGINRIISENFIEDSENYVMKRYFTLTLTYNIGKPMGNFD